MIFDHIRRLQVLNHNCLVLIDVSPAGFMQRILTLVCNLLVDTCHISSRLAPSSAPLRTRTQTLLRLRQSLKTTLICTRVLDRLAVAIGYEIRDAHI